MAVKKKHRKSHDAVTRRISVLRWEIDERKEELLELAQLLQQYEFSAQVDLRCLADDFDIKPVSLI